MAMSDLGILDYIIIIFLLWGLWKGFNSGFVKSVVSLVGWFLALVLGTKFAGYIAPSLASYFSSEILQMAVAFLLIVLIVICIVHILGSVLTKLLTSLKLGIVDKLAGGILGAVRHTLILLIVMSAVAPLLIQSPIWSSSVLAPELLPYSPMAKTLTHEVVGQAWDQINQVDR